jgi:predicted acyltransferase
MLVRRTERRHRSGASTLSQAAPVTTRRVAALDVLRGASVTGMILVNHPGNWLAVYPPLQHASWNGCTAADLIFPCFIVVMGVAMAFALDPPVNGVPSPVIHRRVLMRTVVLIGLGLLLNAAAVWPNLSSLRLPGVLQRIGLTYGLTALIVVHVRHRSQVVIAGVFLMLHWLILIGSPFSAGTGGVVAGQNVADWLDRLVLGTHLLHSTADPEGLLGTLPSVSTALIGVAAGRLVRRSWNDQSVVVRGLTRLGASAAVAGATWSFVWPMNKSLWTGSYALFASGVALIVLAGVCWLVSRLGVRLFKPLEWLGTNALAVYVGSELLGHLLDRPLFRRGTMLFSGKDLVFWGWLAPFIRDGGGKTSSLLYATAYAVVWLGVAALLHRRSSALRA